MTGIEINPHVKAENVHVDQQVKVLNQGNFDEIDKEFFKHEKVNNFFLDDNNSD